MQGWLTVQRTPGRVVSLDELDSKFSESVVKAGRGKPLVCFQCGTCAASCPIMKFDETYSPRTIIRSAVLGLTNRLLERDLIWLCAACYSCTERCPRGVRPAEVISTIRNIIAGKGYIHQSLKMQATAIARYGRLWEDEEFVNEIRGDMGLPPISPVTLQEVAKILEHTKLKELLGEQDAEDKP